MPIGLEIQEVLSRVIKGFGHVDGQFQKQCFELIGLCRTVQKEVTNVQHHRMLLSLIDIVDKAIQACVKGTGSKNPVDKLQAQESIGRALDSIESHIVALSLRAHHSFAQFSERLKTAQALDQARQTKLEDIKAGKSHKTHDYTTQGWDNGKSVKMDFIFPEGFHKSSTLINRTLELHEQSTFEEVIWLFSRAPRKEQRITLKDNMQFYNRTLMEPFSTLSPVEAPGRSRHQSYHVLTDRPSHILFDFSVPRIFGNMWKTNGRTLLKEFNGTVVEGETLRKSIPVKKFSRNSTRENHLTWENIIEEALVHDNHYTVFAGEPEPEQCIEMPSPAFLEYEKSFANEPRLEMPTPAVSNNAQKFANEQPVEMVFPAVVDSRQANVNGQPPPVQFPPSSASHKVSARTQAVLAPFDNSPGQAQISSYNVPNEQSKGTAERASAPANQGNAQPVFMPNNYLKPSPNTASAIPVKEVVRPTFNEPKPRPRREFPTDDLSRGQHPTSARSQPQNVAQPLHDRGIRVADTNVPERVTFTPVEPRIIQKEPARPPVRRGFVRWCKDKLGIA